MTSGVYERTPEMKANMSASRTPEVRDAISAAQSGVPKTPEHCASISAALSGVSFSPEHCAMLSEARRKSDAVKAHSDAMRGGDDIVWHHTLYDHSDLSKNRVAMTRSNHMMGHRVLQKLGIEIPHINVKEVI